MKNNLKTVLILLLILQVFIAEAQENAYWDEIQNFKQEDSLHVPPKNAILFVGSSSFRFWGNIQAYFPSSVIINRGFGGSKLADVIHYADDIIFPYQPKQIVIYCGENDIAETDSAAIVFARTKKLIELIQKKLPSVNIAYVSIKPSPSRKEFLPQVKKANVLIKEFLSQQHNTVFIDVYHPMLTESGKPMPHIFTKDSLHMNDKGYAIWQKVISPHIMK